MLAEEQIEHFRTFGFLVLVGALDGVTLGGLIEEVDAAIAAAGPRDTETGGVTGHYIPAGDRQASAELVQRFQPLAEQLLGREASRSLHTKSCSLQRRGGTLTWARACRR
jgi:hypothetical protein